MTNLNVPFVDLKKINATYKKKFLHSLNIAIKNSNFIKGKKTELLEKKLCKVFECKIVDIKYSDYIGFCNNIPGHIRDILLLDYRTILRIETESCLFF